MRRVHIVLFLVIAVTATVGAQVDRLETYQENFSASNLQTKLEIVRAADGEDAASFGPFYGQTLRFVVSNAEDLDTERALREIALESIDRIEEGQYTAAVGDLWRLFTLYSDSTTRIRILEVIGEIGAERPEETGYLADWVATQNNLRSGGGDVDLQVLTTAVDTLGKLQMPVAFEPILDVILTQYPDSVTNQARESLSEIEGVPLELASDVIRSKDVPDKGSAFLFFMENDDYLSDSDKLELALLTLNEALRAQPATTRERETLRQLRFTAANRIREGSYEPATNEVIRHFNETVLEFDRGQIPKNRVLEAIATLGAMGNEEAAARLTDYLELLNTYTERDRPYDMQVLLATIRNLEILDDPDSYNALFMTTILENYPDRVRDAAREAADTVSQ
ncbi:MAG: hypothetical protein ACLFR8_10130 [Alkalispirochaeta sp.]